MIVIVTDSGFGFQAEALEAGRMLCERDPRPDDGTLYRLAPPFEDMLGRPEWAVGAYDRLVSGAEMDQARASNGLRVHGRGIV